MFITDRKLWLGADRETVVEDGDPRAAFLLAAAGDEIPDAEAERLSLTSKPRKAREKVVADADGAGEPDDGDQVEDQPDAEPEPEAKQVAPAANKGRRRPAANK